MPYAASEIALCPTCSQHLGGGMHVGLNDPMYTSHLRQGGRTAPGRVPPGARFDPINPQGLPVRSRLAPPPSPPSPTPPHLLSKKPVMLSWLPGLRPFLSQTGKKLVYHIAYPH